MTPALTKGSDRNATFTPQGRCYNISCVPGKTINITNNTCTTALSLVRGLLYSLNFTLLPEENITFGNSSANMTSFGHGLLDAFQDKVVGFTFWYSVVFDVTVTSPFVDVVSVHGVRVTGHLRSSMDIARDEEEGALVDNLQLTGWKVFVQPNRVCAFTPRSQAVGLDHVLNGTSKVTFKRERSFLSYPHDNYIVYEIKHIALELTPFLVCPFVELQESDVAALVSNESEYDSGMLGDQGKHDWDTIVLNGKMVSLSRLPNARRENGKVKVCVSELKSLLADLPSRRVGTDSPSWEYALSMTVIPLSILSLLVLLFVYLALPELRTQPGLNVMGTCGTLLVAQVALLLASHQVVTGLWCVGLGMLLHWAWLSVFCWNSVSSLHMFQTFSLRPLYEPYFESRVTVTCRNFIVTLLVPAAVVGLVVVSSSMTYRKASLGYSGRYCYLNSRLLVAVAMVLPVSLMVALNLLLYALTVFRIQRVSRLQVSQDILTRGNKKHVTACLRLSLLTGTTWLLTLLAENLELSWLRALSMLTNGGQGTLLLVSYVTTSRVLGLLTDKVGRRNEVKSRATSSAEDGVMEGPSSSQ